MSEIDDIRMKAFRRIVKECGPVLLIDGNTEEAMSTTNDTPGKYSLEDLEKLRKAGEAGHAVGAELRELLTGEQPKREPMLSDSEMDRLYPESARCGPDAIAPFDDLAEAIRDFYEDKIQRGELIVVKTTKFEDRKSFIHCTTCGWKMAWEAEGLCDKFKSCPGCTAKIIDG